MPVVLLLLQGVGPQLVDYSDETGVYVEYGHEDVGPEHSSEDMDLEHSSEDVDPDMEYSAEDVEIPVDLGNSVGVSSGITSSLSPKRSSPRFRAPKYKSFGPLNRSNTPTGSSPVISCHRWKGNETARRRSPRGRSPARTTTLMMAPPLPRVTSRARWRTPLGWGQ